MLRLAPHFHLKSDPQTLWPTGNSHFPCLNPTSDFLFMFILIIECHVDSQFVTNYKMNIDVGSRNSSFEESSVNIELICGVGEICICSICFNVDVYFLYWWFENFWEHFFDLVYFCRWNSHWNIGTFWTPYEKRFVLCAVVWLEAEWTCDVAESQSDGRSPAVSVTSQTEIKPVLWLFSRFNTFYCKWVWQGREGGRRQRGGVKEEEEEQRSGFSRFSLGAQMEVFLPAEENLTAWQPLPERGRERDIPSVSTVTASLHPPSSSISIIISVRLLSARLHRQDGG